MLGWVGCAVQQLGRRKAEPLDGCADPWPLFSEELLPFCLEQQIARTGIDEHAQASLGLNQTFVHQLLIALEDRKRINPIYSRDIAHRRQRVAFLENSVQNHRDHTVAKLAVDRLTVIPLTVHQGFQFAFSASPSVTLSASSRSARGQACPLASYTSSPRCGDLSR